MPQPILYYETFLHSEPQKEWILLIHGAGGSIRTWKKQTEALSKDFHLLIVDLPGHGNSKGRTDHLSSYTFDIVSNLVWEVVEHLKLPSIHLMGVSLGAIIAMHMEKQRPDHTSSLVLPGAIVKLDTKLQLIANFSLGLAKLIGYQSFYKFAAKIALPRKNHKKSREIFVRESRFLSDDEFRKWTAMYGNHLNDTLQKIYSRVTETPTLLVMGEQDHLFLKQAKKYVSKHTRHQLEIILKCGHLVNLERAALFNEISLRFLQNKASS